MMEELAICHGSLKVSCCSFKHHHRISASSDVKDQHIFSAFETESSSGENKI